MRTCLAVLVVMACLAAPAQAGTVLVREDGTSMAGPWQEWVDSARVPTPEIELRVSFSNPAGIEDVAYSWPGTPILYVPKPDMMTRRLLLHELGHVYDWLYLTDQDRAAVMERVLRREGPWRTSPNSPHEQFAEAYSVVATTRIYRPVVWGFRLRLSRGEFDLLRAWLWNIPRVRSMGL